MVTRWQFLLLLPYQEAQEQQDLWAQTQDQGRTSQTIKAPPRQWGGHTAEPQTAGLEKAGTSGGLRGVKGLDGRVDTCAVSARTGVRAEVKNAGSGSGTHFLTGAA